MTAYTNRFLALANLVRNLYTQYDKEPTDVLRQQLVQLKRRIRMLRNVQVVVAVSFFVDVLCTIFLYLGWPVVGMYVFVGALLLMLLSLGMFVYEAYVSLSALEIQLKELN